MIKQIVLTEEEYDELIYYKQKYYKLIGERHFDDVSYYRVLEKFKRTRFFIERQLKFNKWYLEKIKKEGKDTTFTVKNIDYLEKLLYN